MRLWAVYVGAELKQPRELAKITADVYLNVEIHTTHSYLHRPSARRARQSRIPSRSSDHIGLYRHRSYTVIPERVIHCQYRHKVGIGPFGQHRNRSTALAVAVAVMEAVVKIAVVGGVGTRVSVSACLCVSLSGLALSGRSGTQW